MKLHIILHVTKFLSATYELEETFAKAAIGKNFQAAASEINIRCKELCLTTFRLQKNLSPGNRIKFLYFMWCKKELENTVKLCDVRYWYV